MSNMTSSIYTPSLQQIGGYEGEGKEKQKGYTYSSEEKVAMKKKPDRGNEV